MIFTHWALCRREAGASDLVVDEEAELEWDGVVGPVTWSLLAPARSHRMTIVITSVLAGLVTFLASVTLRYPVIRNLFVSEAVTVSVFILGWLTVAISLQSLVTQPPHEVASWRHSGSTDLHSLARPLILLVCQLSVCVGIYFWNIFNIANIFYVLQCLLPLLWLLGLQPPPEAFFLWLGEQAGVNYLQEKFEEVILVLYSANFTFSKHIFSVKYSPLSQMLVVCLGGSPTASSIKLLVQLFTALLQLLIMLREFLQDKNSTIALLAEYQLTNRKLT